MFSFNKYFISSFYLVCVGFYVSKFELRERNSLSEVFSFRDCVFVLKRTSVTFICRNGKIFFYILNMGLDVFSPPLLCQLP